MTEDYYVRALLSTAFIVAILYTFYVLTQKYQRKSNQGNLKVTDRLWLQKGVGVLVVQHCKSKFLIGVSEKQLSLLKELPENDEAEQTSSELT